MLRYASHPNIGIERIDAWTDPKLHIRAAQVSQLIAWAHDYYMRPKEEGGMGLNRLDNTDPPGSPGDVDWRVPRIQASGPVQEKRLEFIGAFDLTKSGHISDEDAALQGLLVLTKERVCARASAEGPVDHQPTEIFELDSRVPGVARLLLRQADIHPEDPVTLTVAEGNKPAIDIYHHYGFEFTGGRPVEYGVFDVKHLPMTVPGDVFLENLNRAPAELLT